MFAPRSDLLQSEEGLRRTQEDLGLAILDIVDKVLLLDEDLHPFLVRFAVEVGPRELGDHLVPEDHMRNSMLKVFINQDIPLSYWFRRQMVTVCMHPKSPT